MRPVTSRRCIFFSDPLAAWRVPGLQGQLRPDPAVPHGGGRGRPLLLRAAAPRARGRELQGRERLARDSPGARSCPHPPAGRTGLGCRASTPPWEPWVPRARPSPGPPVEPGTTGLPSVGDPAQGRFPRHPLQRRGRGSVGCGRGRNGVHLVVPMKRLEWTEGTERRRRSGRRAPELGRVRGGVQKRHLGPVLPPSHW